MKLILKIIWLIVIAAAVYAGFLVYGNYQVANAPAEKPDENNIGLQPASDIQTYQNPDYKFEISCSKEFSRDTTGQSPIEDGNIQYNFEFPVIPPAAVFNLSPDNYKNTGFKSAYFSVIVYQGKNNISNCTDLLPAKDGQNNRTAITIDGKDFLRYDWSDNAIGGQRGIGYVYFGSYNDKCIMMDGFLSYRDERGFVDNNPRYLEDPAIKDILSKFDFIAKTFKSI